MLTAGEIAEWLGAAVEGDPGVVIEAANTLEEAGPGEIAFADGSVGGSRAGCLVVGMDGEQLEGRTLIRVENPRGAFATVLERMYLLAPEPGVHETAVVAESAVVDASASVGPYVAIGEGCRVGAGCVLHARVTLYANVRVGQRAILHSGCVIGADGFGFVLEGGRYRKFPQVGGVRVGDDVEIGANTTIDRGALGDTVIGDGVKLDDLVHIGHNCRLGAHVVIAAQTGLSGGVVVEDHVVMGGQVGIGEKAQIGSQAMIGGQGGILPQRRVKGGVAYWGTPARPHREYLRSLAAVETIGKLKARIAELERRVKGSS